MTKAVLIKSIKSNIKRAERLDKKEEPDHIDGCEVNAWIVAALYTELLHMVERLD